MKMKHIRLFAVVMLAGLIITSCKKKKDDEEELITTLKIVLRPAGSGSPLTFTWKDVDGPGGSAPIIDSFKVAPATTYSCSLQFLNESVSPAKDVTPEILSEATAHQVYYQVTGAQLTFSGFNNDANGLPLGTTSTCISAAASSGSVKITLKHKPGIKAANDPVTKGETDIEVVFPAAVK